jgi:hypothetical protein
LLALCSLLDRKSLDEKALGLESPRTRKPSD